MQVPASWGIPAHVNKQRFWKVAVLQKARSSRSSDGSCEPRVSNDKQWVLSMQKHRMIWIPACAARMPVLHRVPTTAL